MDRWALEKFLFQVAGSGYTSVPLRNGFSFPAIAQFGVGFISILTRASQIVIHTSNGGDKGKAVRLNAESTEAYVEHLEKLETGTSVAMKLRYPTVGSELREFFAETFRYTSVPVHLIMVQEMRSAAADVRAHEGVVPFTLEPLLRLVDSVPLTNFLNTLTIVQFLEAANALVTEKGRSMEKSGRTRGLMQSFLVASATQFPRLPMKKFVCFGLSDDFLILGARESDMPDVSAYCHVVWIPVEYVDFNEGIEWASVHGVCIRAEEATNVIRGPARRPRHIDDDEPGSLLDDPYGFDVEDGDDRLGTYDGWGVGPPLLVQRVTGIMITEILQGDSGEDERVDDEDAFEPVSFRSIRREGGSLAKGKRAISDQLLDDLVKCRRVLNNTAFQDGIRLSVSPRDIAPVGAVFASLNLTGRARMALNVARNAADESPGAIESWFANTGSRIQIAVLDQVQAAFDALGCAWSMDGIQPATDPKLRKSPYLAHGLRRLEESAREVRATRRNSS